MTLNKEKKHDKPASRQAQISWNVTREGNEKSVTWPMQFWSEDLEYLAEQSAHDSVVCEEDSKESLYVY